MIMKKIFFIAGVILFSTTASMAQSQDIQTKKEKQFIKKENRAEKKEEALSKPSVKAGEQFAIDFPGAANVTWTRSAFERAKFVKDGKTINAFYDWDGGLVGTTNRVDYAVLPKAAKEKIQKEYKDYTVNEVILYDDNEINETDMILYDTSFDDADNYFVDLTKGSKNIILKVSMEGTVSFFKDMPK